MSYRRVEPPRGLCVSASLYCYGTSRGRYSAGGRQSRFTLGACCGFDCSAAKSTEGRSFIRELVYKSHGTLRSMKDVPWEIGPICTH